MVKKSKKKKDPKESIDYYPNGTLFYYKDGKLHREDGPAIECPEGLGIWYLNGERHRDDGPAFDSSDFKIWYKNGLLHREDGPAIEWEDGSFPWYVDGKKIDTPRTNIIWGCVFVFLAVVTICVFLGRVTTLGELWKAAPGAGFALVFAGCYFWKAKKARKMMRLWID